MSSVIKALKNRIPDIKDALYIADNVYIAGSVKLSKNVSIWPNTTIRADLGCIVIGENSNIQENCVIHVAITENDDYISNPKGHVIIGKNTSIAHGCIIHGCQIGDDCLIGMGSIVGDGAIIEDGAFVGAGSNITPRTVVKSGELWVGNPARFMRKLTEKDIEYIKMDAITYVKLAKEYLANGEK